MSAPWEVYVASGHAADHLWAGTKHQAPHHAVRFLRADRVVELLREVQNYMFHAPICRGMPQCNCGYLDLVRRIDAVLGKGGGAPVE